MIARTKLLTTCLLAALTMVLAACSGGSGELATVNNNPNNGGNTGGGGNQTSPATDGRVTLAVKDAPLADLQSLTIDVTRAVLRSRSASDHVLFPNQNGSGSVSVDLLSLQGLNRVMASGNVAPGDYYAIELEYSNPSALNASGTAQNISTVGTRMVGLFSPDLQVSAGSNQAIQVDVDLQRSYVDLGGNSGFLAPVIEVNVLSQAVPVRRFPALVWNIDTANDSFEADLAFFGPNAPPVGAAGSITVQCDPSTTFVDGMGIISTGNVTSQLMAGDLVEIDGTLLGGTVNASSVARYATTQPGNGTGNGGTPNTPPVIDLSGTIVGVDSVASTMDVLIDSVAGPGQLPALQSTVTLEITNQTALHRGPQQQLLRNFIPGNYLYAFAQRGALGGFEALDLDEFPSLITGIVQGVLSGAGAKGMDQVTLTPERVNQIPVTNLPFVPSPLMVDIPAGFPPQQGLQISVFAFFDGSSYLQPAGNNFGGPNVQPPFGGGNTGGGSTGGGGGQTGGGRPGGGTGNGNGPITFTGEKATGTTASLDANGHVDFDLELGSGQVLDVLVDSGATMELVDPTAGSLTISASDAVNVLNNVTLAVEVSGSSLPQGTSFSADISLRIHASASTLPGGGGNTGGNPGGGTGGGANTGGGNPGGTSNVVFGQTSRAATGIIPLSFTLTLPPSPNTPSSLSVTVTGSPQYLLMDSSGQANTQPTLQELVTAMNTQGTTAECVGTLNAQQASFNCDISLTVFMARTGGGTGGNPGGGVNIPDVAVGNIVGQATLANGVLTFTMTGSVAGQGTQAQGTFTVTVSQNAVISLVSRNGGRPSIITPQQALAALNNRPTSVQAEGDYDAQAATFDCNIALTIVP